LSLGALSLLFFFAGCQFGYLFLVGVFLFDGIFSIFNDAGKLGLELGLLILEEFLALGRIGKGLGGLFFKKE
jgi:hypothetical protein